MLQFYVTEKLVQLEHNRVERAARLHWRTHTTPIEAHKPEVTEPNPQRIGASTVCCAC